MIIIRRDENPNNIPFELEDSDLGLNYISNSRNVFDVIDEQIFFLMVVKHSIVFEEVYNVSVGDFYDIKEYKQSKYSV